MFKSLLRGSTLFSSTISYSFFSILNSAGPFFLIPFLTGVLTKEGYGIVAMFSLLITFISPFIGLSLNGAFTKFYFSLSENNFKKLVYNCLLVFGVSLITLLLGIFLFRRLITELTSIPYEWVFAAVLVSAFQFLQLTSLLLWQVHNKAFRYGIFQLSYTLLNLGLSIALILCFNFNWQGRLLGWVLAAFIMAVFSIINLYREGFLQSVFDKELIQKALKFSIPLIPHSIGGILIGLSDRFIVNKIEGLESTAIYSVAFQLSSMFNILMTAFNTAYTPWLFKKLNESDENSESKKKIVGLTYISFLVIIVGVIVLGIVLDLLFSYIIGKEFAEAKQYLFILLIGFGFNGMYLMVTNYTFYAQKTSRLASNTILIGLINLPICYFLTKNYGLVGASYATCIAYFLMFVSNCYISITVFPMPWRRPIFRF